MKRVAVLSFHKTTNYGCALQQAALFKSISNLGYDATFIANTQTPRIAHIYRIHYFQIFRNGLRKVFSAKKAKRVTLDYDGKRVSIFRGFQNEMLKASDENSCYSDFQALNGQFDAFVCGSDQIWSPSWFDEKYFLPFVEDPEKLIAYAPSFGVSSVDDREIGEFMSEAIGRFAHLSVREAQGVDIIKKLTGRDAVHVLDPTLLLTPDEWDSITAQQDTGISGRYIICYFLGDTAKYIKSVKALSEKLGIPAYIIPVYDTDMDLDIAKVDYPVGPREFVSLIKNSEYVCTDSFHGAVFALNFGKQLAVFERDSKKNKASMNSRLYSLLDMFSLRDRLVDYNDANALTSLPETDISAVEKKLCELREKSLSYLENALREATSHTCTARKSLKEYNPSEIINYVIDKDLCSGCSACTCVCPTGALTIEMNDAGFRHYVIDKEKCIGCGQCKKVCPMQKNDAADIMTGRLYGVKSKDKAVLKASSSGGLCYMLAKSLNEAGYAVAGCEYNAEKGCAEHSIVPPCHPDEIRKYQGSKYIQSDIGDVFAELMKLDKAAFFGTPCQVAGLHKLLTRCGKRDNFILAEIICMGVPSMKVWKKYLNAQKKRLHCNSFDKVSVSFRSKKLGWVPHTITLSSDKKELTETQSKSNFYTFFLHCDTMSEACYECPYRTRSYADIRIGDYWGGRYYGDREGVSEAVTMTEAGSSAVLSLIKNDAAETEEHDIVEYPSTQSTLNHIKPLYYKSILSDLSKNTVLRKIDSKYYSSFRSKEAMKAIYRKIRKFTKGRTNEQ